MIVPPSEACLIRAWLTALSSKCYLLLQACWWMAGGLHLAGMSTVFGLDFASPTIYRDLQSWEPQPHSQSLHAPQLPHLPCYVPSGLPLSPPSKPPTGCGRPWSCLFCVTFIICQIHESELLTERLARGIGCGEGGPLSWSWSAPMTPSVTWEPLRPPTLPGS